MIFLSAFLCGAYSSAHAEIFVKPGAPASFADMEKPKATVVDVFFGGKSIGSFKGKFSPTSFWFDAPEKIIAKLDNVKDENKIQVQSALGAELPNNAGQICRKYQEKNCGILSPEVTGVIFDEEKFRVDIFINKDFLKLQDNSSARYLPGAEQKFSSILGLSGAVAGSTNAQTNFTINDNTTYSFGETNLNTQSSVSNQGLRFDNVVASRDIEGVNQQAGLFRSRAMQLIPDHDMAGVAISTSMNTRLDAHKVQGNDVAVYLPRRSWVSIYRDGKLYSSNFYEAGNQLIDTTELPEGAYFITLHIQGSDGSVTEERRFFAKSPDLPPPGDPVYYAEGGVIRKPAQLDDTMPNITDHPIMRLGTVQRLTEYLGVDTGLLGLDDQVAGEASFFGMYDGQKIRTSIMSSSRGDYGLQASYEAIFDKLSVSMDTRKVWAGDDRHPAYDPVSNGLAQTTATINYQITPDLTASAHYNNSWQENSSTQNSYGPGLEYYAWRSGENSLAFTTDVSKTNQGVVGTAFVRFSMKLGEWGLSGTTGATAGGSNHGEMGNVHGTWSDDKSIDHKTLAGIGFDSDRNSRSIGGDIQYNDNFGMAKGNVQEAQNTNGNMLNYGGQFNFGVAQVGDRIEVGGDRMDWSAVIVDVTGDAGIPMQIMVNNIPRQNVMPGTSQTIYLSPYQTYAVRIVAAKDGLYDYDTGNRAVTLYPGNVTKLEWEVDKAVLLVGHVVDKDGNILVNATLLAGKNQIVTNEDGRFQAEVHSAKTLQFQKDDVICTVTLPLAEEKNGVLVYRDKLVCE